MPHVKYQEVISFNLPENNNFPVCVEKWKFYALSATDMAQTSVNVAIFITILILNDFISKLKVVA